MALCLKEPETAAVTRQQADLAADAAQRFGTGPQSDALTLGDCFAYALAQIVGLPLFRDERFWQTDVTAALVPE